MSKIIGYVDGADLYLIVSLIIFMLVFLVVCIQLFTMSKETSDKLSMLPFNPKNDKDHEN